VGDSSAWRPVFAALANATARRVYAEAVVSGGASATWNALSPSRRRHVLALLESSGLVASEGDGSLRADGRVFAEVLAAAPAARRPVGPERFLRPDGRIAAYPAAAGERRELLALIAARAFTDDEILDEREVNARLAAYADDVAVLRRYLVDHELLERTPSGSEYARVWRE
jgi:hypothetical protein